MAEKSNEEYLSESTDNTSEIATPSNDIADENGEGISGAICTISPSLKIMSEISYSFDDPDSKISTLELSMKKIVGKFFDKVSDDKYKIPDNDIVNVNENNHNDLVDIIDVINNDHINLIDINNDANNEPGNVYAADDDNRRNMLVTYKTYGDTNYTTRNLNFFFNGENSLKISFSDDIKYSTPKLALSPTLTPRMNFSVDFIKQGQECIDFMSVFTEYEFCKPFLENVFSYLSYRDIASMTTVSTTWRKAVIKSVNAQKELEKVFIHAILYFCHKNANVTDEYKQLFDKILIHFKNQIQFKKNDF